MTRLGIIIAIILTTGIIFYTNYDRPSSSPPTIVVEKNKGPWKFLHCTSNNKDCGKLE